MISDYELARTLLIRNREACSEFNDALFNVFEAVSSVDTNAVW